MQVPKARSTLVFGVLGDEDKKICRTRLRIQGIELWNRRFFRTSCVKDPFDLTSALRARPK